MTGLNHRQALLATAHHEAGHAVIAAHLGIPVTSLNLNDQTNTDGWSVDGITYVIYNPSIADAMAVQAAAGEVAALRWLDQHNLRSPETLQLINADHDRDETIALLDQDGIHADWSMARVQAEALVRDLWPHISAVAHTAVQHGFLTGTEVNDLISHHTAWGFAQSHGTTDDWSTADFEAFENLAACDAMHRAADYQTAA